ncbi:MAG: WG repeat-containing protein [Candidatus Heimdallarchaeaceae archaeon]
MDLKKIKVSKDNTHHLLHGKPLYQKRFKHVLKFHPPALAPVLDHTGAYHIKLDGEPAYSQRFIRTFGYYFEKAAVITEKGWGHIDTKGNLIYEPVYAWVGNFQDNICTVRDKNGYYFHIDESGSRLYKENMLYAGDFKDGVAVVRTLEGVCVHIYKDGSLVHNKKFIDLDVFHKGFARARDVEGWFHIDMKGNNAYEKKFAQIEPFYNGYAYVEDFEGNKLIIDEQGETIHKVSNINKIRN